MTYAEQLKDPRWQRKRLRVLERDGWTCQNCGDTEKTLNVHHLVYRPNTPPWKYSDDELVTTCEDCHSDDHAIDDLRQDAIIAIMRKPWTPVRSLEVDRLTICLERGTK